MHVPVPVVGVPDTITREQAKSGPFLDRLFAIQVTRGRTCFVNSFSADATYVGVIEGGMYPEPDGSPDFMRGRAEEGPPLA